MWVHYADPRLPCGAPASYRALYPGGDEILGSAADLERLWGLDVGSEGYASLRAALERRYASEVSYVDAEIGALLQGLHDRGLLNRSVVVLTATHGLEMAARRKPFSHRGSVYQGAVAVPFLLRLPGGQGVEHRVTARTHAADVAPTVLSLLGLEGSVASRGVSLTPLLRGDGLAPRFVTAAAPAGRGGCQAVWDHDFKLVQCPDRPAELYHLGEDPNEERDLTQGAPVADRVAVMLEVLNTEADAVAD